MQTVNLCGGLGTRLREETEYRPKPMVHIGNKPILWHIMKIYAHYGHYNFVLTLGYKGNTIKDYFLHYEAMNNDVTLELGKPESLCMHNCHEEGGWKITLANTGESTLKGGRLKRVERYIYGDTFMLTYGDGVADIDIQELIGFHHSHGKMVTVTGVRPIARFGELLIKGNQVRSFQEKPQVSSDGGLISGGFFVFNRRIFNYLTEDENCDLEHGPLEDLAAKGELMVYKHDLKPDPNQPHEAGLLKLDCSKARIKLNWHQLWNAEQALQHTAAWYKNYYLHNTVRSRQDLEEYIQAARKNGICWATEQSENNK